MVTTFVIFGWDGDVAMRGGGGQAARNRLMISGGTQQSRLE